MEQAPIIAAIFFGGLVSGCSGFAFSAVAGAILYHFIDPVQAVALMLVCSIISQSLTLMALRKRVYWRESIPMLGGGILGVPGGVYLLTVIDKQTFRCGFGVFLSCYALFMLLRSARATAEALGARAAADLAVGSAGGVVGGLTAMPGAIPVIWCNLCGMNKERQRGIVQPFIIAMQVIAMSLLFLHPSFRKADLISDTLLVLPALAMGTFLGFAFFGRIDEAMFRKVVLRFSCSQAAR